MLYFTLARDSAESIGAAVRRNDIGGGGGSRADPVEKDISTAATMSRREITQRLRHVTGKKNCRLWKGEYCEMNGSGFLYPPLSMARAALEGQERGIAVLQNTCCIFPQSSAEVQSPHFNLPPLPRTHCLPTHICARDDVIIACKCVNVFVMECALRSFFLFVLRRLLNSRGATWKAYGLQSAPVVTGRWRQQDARWQTGKICHLFLDFSIFLCVSNNNFTVSMLLPTSSAVPYCSLTRHKPTFCSSQWPSVNRYFCTDRYVFLTEKSGNYVVGSGLGEGMLRV